MADPTVYQPTTWVDNTTPLSAQNLNNLETQYQDAQELMQSRYAVAHGPMLIALCGFDGSLDTSRGVRGTFSRSSAANNPATLATEGDNVPSYVPGYWGNSKGALSIWEGTTNLVYNSDFETVTTTTQVFGDPLTSSAAWTVQAGSFTYSASGATSGAGNSSLSAGNPVWVPLLGSDGTTNLTLAVQATFTMPASADNSLTCGFLLNGSNHYRVVCNANFYIEKLVNGTASALGAVAQATAASATYTTNLALDHLGNMTAKLYSGSGTGGTLLQTISVNDTALSGPWLATVGGDTGVVITNASVTAPWANGWTTGTDAAPNGAYALTTDAAVGKYAMSVVTESSTAAYPQQTFSVSASTTYTVSYYAKIVSGSPTVGIRCIEENSSGTVLVDTNNTHTVNTTNGVYQRITYTVTTTSTTSSLLIRTEVQGGGTVEFDAVQLEQKGYSSPYLENDSTTGTATRATEEYTLPATLLNPNEGTIAFWWMPGVSDTVAPPVDFFYLFVYGNPGTDGMFPRFRSGSINFVVSQVSIPVSYSGGWTIGEALHIAATWSNGEVTFYVNGVAQGSSAWIPPSNPQPFLLGYRQTYTEADSAFDDLCFFSVALTPAQVYSLYSATVPLIDTYANPVAPDTQVYNQTSSLPDANDVYTVVTYTRRDGTTYLVSTLSGTVSPAGSSNYPTLTWQYYDATGTVVTRTQTFALAYDSYNHVVSQAMTN